MKLPAQGEAELTSGDTGIPYDGSIPSAPLHVAESATVYRPRHPEQTSFYQELLNPHDFKELSVG
jgi:hypothetical protein